MIYQIWHTAWPEKNVELLKSLAPDVEKGYDKIVKAEVPGILRDKKMKWEESVKKFGGTVKAYMDASKKNDAQAFLNVAEKLHSEYEGLVRVIKPMIKEVDAFHQVLYMLYHYYYPENKFDKIKESAAQLKIKMEALNKVQLSAKMKAKEEAFGKARTELSTAVDKLIEVTNAGNNKKDIDNAVDGVHSKYEALEKIFN